jgi:kynurenine formamidase
VVDLTVPLESATPTIQLPPPFAPSKPFSLEEISHYDERGPAWYWNNIACGEHTGTHFDAPIHWVTGKDYANNATHNIPVERFIGPACVIDVAAQAKANPDFLLTREVVEEWERKNGRMPGFSSAPTGRIGRERKNFSTQGPTARTLPAFIRSACHFWRRSATFSVWVWRPSARTPGRLTVSILCFPATPSCTARTDSDWRA